MLSKKQCAFVQLIIEGTPPAQAYALAFAPKTGNPDSLRAMASRERAKPDVSAAIDEGLQAIRDSALQDGLWNYRASILHRLADLELIDVEINRRIEGLDIEIDGIESHYYSPAEKKMRTGRAMQKGVVTRDLIAAKMAIYASLDAMTGTSDSGESKSAAFIDATDFEENPMDFAANTAKSRNIETD